MGIQGAIRSLRSVAVRRSRIVGGVGCRSHRAMPVPSAWLSLTPQEPTRLLLLLLPMSKAGVDGGAQETRRPDRVRAGGWLQPLVASRLKLQGDKDVAEKHPSPDTQ